MVKKHFSCHEHIDALIDIFLDEYETMPVMNQLTKTDETCEQCKQQATYELTESDVKISWD